MFHVPSRMLHQNARKCPIYKPAPMIIEASIVEHLRALTYVNVAQTASLHTPRLLNCGIPDSAFFAEAYRLNCL